MSALPVRKCKAATRYNSMDSQSQTTPSSSTEFTTSNSNHNAIVKSDRSNLTSMVKKFMEKRSAKTILTSKTNSDRPLPLIIPADFIAQDLKKTARKGSNFSALPKKLFGKGSNTSSSEKKVKALTEVKANTRTLAMVLRSERELLSSNKDQELQISQLLSLLQERNLEVEKLKDLCLKQREEIKALKTAVLFPEEMNSQLHQILEKQGSELHQAKLVIPNLQTQISSLTAQLQNLSHDIAEVKAVKYTGRPSLEGNFSSPRTPIYDQQEAANSLDFSDDDPTTPDSPDDMLLKDVNPCLTPCYSKIKSKEYGSMVRDYTEEHEEEIYKVTRDSRKMSRSSDHFKSFRPGSNTACASFRRSDESKYRYGKRNDHQYVV